MWRFLVGLFWRGRWDEGGCVYVGGESRRGVALRQAQGDTRERIKYYTNITTC